MPDIQPLLATASGGAVGFLLGLLGGGGSVLAVPLLLYVVGVSNPHMAIGTSALGVSANAAVGLFGHARKGSVKWPCAVVFSIAGLAGAFLGSSLGKMVNPQPLMLLFAAAMIGVAASMFRSVAAGGDPDVHINPQIGARLAVIGFVAGLASGFFGIGGGFLIVPGLMLGSGMPMPNAVGSSLVSVTVFGAATAANYALSGFVLWDVAGWMILGGVMGGALGVWASQRLSARRAVLQRIFAGFVLIVAGWVAYNALSGAHGR